MNIYEKLRAVQQELIAPKNQYNSFGEFKYRSAESIIEAVKPLLMKYIALICLSDEIVEVGGRVYVKATATFLDPEKDGRAIQIQAFAREPDDKKKMDSAQITGTASSYARKYALNGLLLIDDTKDADTDEYAKQTQEKQEKPMKNAADDIRELAKKAKVTEAHICTQAGVEKLEDIDTHTYAKLKAALMARIHVNEKLEA